MIILKTLTKERLTQFFLDDPKLICFGLSDDYIVNLYENKEYSLSENSKYLGFYDNNTLVGILKYELFTNIAICVHPYLSSKLHGKGKGQEIGMVTYNFIKEAYPTLTKILVICPESCPKVHAAVERFGMKLEGQLKDTIIWRKQTEDLRIYGMNIVRDE
jgi:predicted GNAT family acetyltransferase